MNRIAYLLLFVIAGSSLVAQSPTRIDNPPATPPAEAKTESVLDGREGRELLMREFFPQSKLKVAESPVPQAKFPVVDVHNHFFYRQRHNELELNDFVQMMDRNNIAVCVSLDGKLGSQLDEHLQFLWKNYRDRFLVFAHLDWVGDGIADQPNTWAANRPGWAERSAKSLAEAKELGVSGLKIFKRLGLEYRDAAGKLITIDDPMLDPIWKACGELGLPVLIHCADPSAFFDPLGPENERWEELSRHPDWHFYGKDYPSRDELLAARNRVFGKHPETIFIGAHMAGSSEDLSQLGQWLDMYPNLYLDPASRISELGRQPYTSRDFLIKYQDRVLFGTDGPWPELRMKSYWRYFQTRDEYFPYSEKEFPPQGFWRIYGVDLPDEVLKKIYHENAARIIPGVKERLSTD